ncbi:MAG: Riboflavin biosynthesis protein RibF [Parcubacteria group bacterium GW2011_GWE2_39_37]|uniref:riboflavin kinase n=1 Tax=Candidatus Falkowbacteria bacterium GW2011_GWF2_39_8 TaxID=1618642 RepID=A0A0G0T3B2_9BACT|nr:MAG: Riboflavin biosynthesis protein RibF [Parcubacteria group bacterium GW2011_GWE2_39_37]KKR32312.1 MAG: Riboflavin biosynthesis protein RibF [Candidatus Falkowbacteria bacterium GW2011_GWF2_39_8]
MYEFSGKVIQGEGRGKKIGFPTVNIDNQSLDLNHGVYLVEVFIGADKNIYRGLLHFGPKKTFNDIISTEVFIDNFSKEIYGEKIKVKVLKKIREIKKFKSSDELIWQMEKDREFLK